MIPTCKRYAREAGGGAAKVSITKERRATLRRRAGGLAGKLPRRVTSLSPEPATDRVALDGDSCLILCGAYGSGIRADAYQSRRQPGFDAITPHRRTRPRDRLESFST